MFFGQNSPTSVISYVNSASFGLGLSGGTTSAVNTTGANFLFVFVNSYQGIPTVTSSPSNTWHARTGYGTSTQAVIYPFYAYNANVSSSQSFTVSGTSLYCSITIVAFKGVLASSDPYDVEAGKTPALSSTSSVAAGAGINPNNNGELLVTGVATQTYPTTQVFSCNSGFTVASQFGFVSGQMAGGIGYKIQGTAAATTPTWAWTGPTTGDFATAEISAFKHL
jgi:hypothetical protein